MPKATIPQNQRQQETCLSVKADEISLLAIRECTCANVNSRKVTRPIP